MANGFLVRTTGGPNDGETRVVPLEWGWPLPNVLPGASLGGVYVKVSESQLPASVDEHRNVMRGAQYEWSVPASGRDGRPS